MYWVTAPIHCILASRVGLLQILDYSSSFFISRVLETFHFRLHSISIYRLQPSSVFLWSRRHLGRRTIALYLTAELFSHPDSNFPDGLSASRQKYISDWILRLTRTIDSEFCPPLPLFLQRRLRAKARNATVDMHELDVIWNNGFRHTLIAVQLLACKAASIFVNLCRCLLWLKKDSWCSLVSYNVY